jgi:hypothetical protein
MQQMNADLSNLNRQLDFIINRALKHNQHHGDSWDQIADDATDARLKIVSAIKVTKIERGKR